MLGPRLCRVAPLPGELKCPPVEGNRPPFLCPAHGREYRQHTRSYKTTNREADGLYRRVSSCNPETLCDLTEVEEALTTALLCIKTFAKAIREREDHHARFFSQRMSYGLLSYML